MLDQNQPRKRLYLLSFAAIAMIAAPRFLPEVELSRATLAWYPTIHQLGTAFFLGTLIWIVTARRRKVALAIGFFALVALGPNIAGAIEYSMTGNNTNVLAIAKRFGITPILNTFYGFLYDALGYSISVAHGQ